MFFASLFTISLLIFKNAFSTYFFNDDFFFLRISRINNINQFVNFFSPIRQVSYKPISQEIFYLLTHFVNENVFIAHCFVFAIYFIGLFYLFKVIALLTKNKILAYLTTLFYAVSFTHVFQLYYLATFQDIAIFTFLCLSFFFFLKEKTVLSLIYFTLALLSKETAILFVPFLVLCKLFLIKKTKFSKIYPFLFLGLIFIPIYQYGLRYVTSLDNYRIAFNPRLIANNSLWYFFWSLGFPNFTSLYFTSIFRPPITDFWKMLTNFPEIKLYYLLLIIYLSLLGVGIFFYLIKNKNKFIKLINVCLFGLLSFFIFLGPILFFEHRWMVRLAVPLIFISLIQGYIVNLLIKKQGIFTLLGLITVGLYLYLQILGISIHESSSTFLLESRFTKNAKRYFETNKKEILKHKNIYFIDKTKIIPMPWGGSEKLKVTLSDQNFIDHYFPKTNLKAVYGFENKSIPKDSYVVNSFDILLPK